MYHFVYSLFIISYDYKYFPIVRGTYPIYSPAVTPWTVTIEKLMDIRPCLMLQDLVISISFQFPLNENILLIIDCVATY